MGIDIIKVLILFLILKNCSELKLSKNKKFEVFVMTKHLVKIYIIRYTQYSCSHVVTLGHNNWSLIYCLILHHIKHVIIYVVENNYLRLHSNFHTGYLSFLLYENSLGQKLDTCTCMYSVIMNLCNL